MELTYSSATSQDPTLFQEQLTGSGRELSAAAERSATEPFNSKDEVSAGASLRNCDQASAEALLDAARSGDGQAFAELTGRYRASIQRRLFRILRNHEDTQDALQDALVKAYTHLDDFRGSCRFSTWLTTIAVNVALMRLRKRKSQREVSLSQPGDNDQTSEIWDFPDHSPDAEQVYARRQAIELLENAAQRLPPHYRSIVHHYHVRERGLQQAAAAVGITVAAAKSRLLRARLTMRSALEKKCISFSDAFVSTDVSQ